MLRERPRDPVTGQVEGASTPSGAGLSSAAAGASDLLARGDAIIDRSISGNSTQFLQSNRQGGGQ